MSNWLTSLWGKPDSAEASLKALRELEAQRQNQVYNNQYTQNPWGQNQAGYQYSQAQQQAQVPWYQTHYQYQQQAINQHYSNIQAQMNQISIPVVFLPPIQIIKTAMGSYIFYRLPNCDVQVHIGVIHE